MSLIRNADGRFMIYVNFTRQKLAIPCNLRMTSYLILLYIWEEIYT